MDPCIYVRSANGILTFIALYVDDLAITGSDLDTVLELKKLLKSIWDMKDLGRISLCLGMEIVINNSTKIASISQAKYIREILDIFNMSNCHSNKIPMEPGLKLSFDMCPIKDSAEYIQMMSIPRLFIQTRYRVCCWRSVSIYDKSRNRTLESY